MEIVESGPEAGYIRGAGEVRRAPDEQGLPIFLGTKGVYPGAPTAKSFAVAAFLPRAGKEFIRISVKIVKMLIS